ncbi:hypothetical protein RJT34_17783 [Clitoria ternatea]|uniref:Uncharacterized protein n=1 Tax=Clitoria ternatea TaxID=43366 RepID=A0AAN9JAU7_CLITE
MVKVAKRVVHRIIKLNILQNKSPSLCSLPSPFPSLQPSQIVNWIFMSSTITGAYFVSCDSGNNNCDNLLFCWILLCLLPKFLGTPFAYINFLLIQAIDRSPSAVAVNL